MNSGRLRCKKPEPPSTPAASGFGFGVFWVLVFGGFLGLGFSGFWFLGFSGFWFLGFSGFWVWGFLGFGLGFSGFGFGVFGFRVGLQLVSCMVGARFGCGFRGFFWLCTKVALTIYDRLEPEAKLDQLHPSPENPKL